MPFYVSLDFFKGSLGKTFVQANANNSNIFLQDCRMRMRKKVGRTIPQVRWVLCRPIHMLHQYQHCLTNTVGEGSYCLCGSAMTSGTCDVA
jgi:hypothetical protein